MKEKVGTANYFFSFPAAEHRRLVSDLESLKESLASAKRKRSELESALSAAKVGREDDGGVRSSNLALLEALKKQKAALEAELGALADNDPVLITDLQKELRMCRDAAHRWTDNIFNCKSFLVNKKCVDRKEAEKYLGITSAFDYPEDKMPKAK